jgi:hypothetical protein
MWRRLERWYFVPGWPVDVSSFLMWWVLDSYAKWNVLWDKLSINLHHFTVKGAVSWPVFIRLPKYMLTPMVSYNSEPNYCEMAFVYIDILEGNMEGNVEILRILNNVCWYWCQIMSLWVKLFWINELLQGMKLHYFPLQVTYVIYTHNLCQLANFFFIWLL